jgi:hypothetical protein
MEAALSKIASHDTLIVSELQPTNRDENGAKQREVVMSEAGKSFWSIGV